MDFRFSDKVLSTFDFLSSKYGFHCVKKEQFFVRYESAKVFINLIFDGTRSYELGIGIGQKGITSGKHEQSFSLGEVLRCIEAPKHRAFDCVQVTTPELLSKFLFAYAELLDRYAKDLITGSESFFRRLSKCRDKECDAYEIETQLRQIRPLADEAWRNKDYAKFTDLLSPIKKHLSGSELKKFKYAKEHLYKLKATPIKKG